MQRGVPNINVRAASIPSGWGRLPTFAKLISALPLPQFTPAAPVLRPAPFDHDDYIFELKMDGFRALAHVDEHETRLISRRGNLYRRFTELAAAVHIELDWERSSDGEIVCLDDAGRPQFYDLLRPPWAAPRSIFMARK
jgi:ATP-dependent DNA ligase